jgi:hypothetical protein
LSSVTALLRHCERTLGRDHRDLNWYDHERPAVTTRSNFFREYSWALLVWNRRRKSAESWARKVGFWKKFNLTALKRTACATAPRLVRVNPANCLGRRLVAMARLAADLRQINDDCFRKRYLLGCRRGKDLGARHAFHLQQIGLYGMGPANSAFIVRNLGGELLKCDRWILALMRLTRMKRKDFEVAAEHLGWGLGRVDTVLWSYCEQEVKATSRLRRHLQADGFKGRWTAK